MADCDWMPEALAEAEKEARDMTESASNWKKACVLMQLSACGLKRDDLRDKDVMETIQGYVCGMYDKAVSWRDYDETILLK